MEMTGDKRSKKGGKQEKSNGRKKVFWVWGFWLYGQLL